MKESFRRLFPINEVKANEKEAAKRKRIEEEIEAKRQKEQKRRDEIERIIISIATNEKYINNLSYNEAEYIAPNGKTFKGVLLCKGVFNNEKAIIAIDLVNDRTIVTIKYAEHNMQTLTWSVQLLELPELTRPLTQIKAQDELYLHPINNMSQFKDFLRPELLGKTTLRTLKRRFGN